LSAALAHKKALEEELIANSKALKDAQSCLATVEAKCKKYVATVEAKAAKVEKNLAEARKNASRQFLSTSTRCR
jgi:hypothetical protein